MAITISGSGITSANIADGTIVNADINSSAAIDGTKVSGSFGKVLQVVSVPFSVNTSTTSTSWVSTGITASITPSSTSSKILIMASDCMYLNTYDKWASWTIFRGTVSGTNLGISSRGMASMQFASGNDMSTGVHIHYLDNPSTTSSQTYTVGFQTTGGTAYSQHFGMTKSSITLMEIGA